MGGYPGCQTSEAAPDPLGVQQPPDQPSAKSLFSCGFLKIMGGHPHQVASQKNGPDASVMPRPAPPYTFMARKDPYNRPATHFSREYIELLPLSAGFVSPRDVSPKNVSRSQNGLTNARWQGPTDNNPVCQIGILLVALPLGS